MISNVGSIEYDARIQTARLKQDAKEAERIASDTSKNIEKEAEGSENRTSNLLSSVMGKVKYAALAATAAVGAAGVATAIFGVKSAADFQQTRIGLENMLGSADKARSLLIDISKFAAETPFEFPELAQATRQLVAFGFSGEDAFNTMKQLGDVSAAVGTPINDLAYLMGTLRTQGRAFTIDIRQFAQRGIPIYEYLAKVLNTNEKEITNMIEAGKIGFPEVQKAFQAMTEEGGKFHGSMEKQSKSLTGLFSTLKDNIGQTIREMIGISVAGDVRKGSVLEFLINGATTATKELPNIINNIGETITKMIEAVRPALNYLVPKFQSLGTTISEEVLPTLLMLWNNVIKPLLPVIGTALVVALGLAVDAFNALLQIITPLVYIIVSHKAVVIDLAVAFGILALAMKFDAITAAFTGNMNAVIGKIGTVRGAIAGLYAFIGAGAVMGSIAIAGALADIELVRRAVESVIGAINAMNAAGNAASAAGVAMDESIRKIKASNLSPEEKARRIRSLSTGVRAEGGPVTANRPYLVGERGPELFVPRNTGNIISNDNLQNRSNVTVNLNLSGIMTRSRSDLRDVARDLTRALNEELVAKGQTPIGNGAI